MPPRLSAVHLNGNQSIDSSAVRMALLVPLHSRLTRFPHFQKTLMFLFLFPVPHPLPSFPPAFSQVAVARSVQAPRLT